MDSSTTITRVPKQRSVTVYVALPFNYSPLKDNSQTDFTMADAVGSTPAVESSFDRETDSSVFI